MSRIVEMKTWICRRDKFPGSSAGDESHMREIPHGSTYVALRLVSDTGAVGEAALLAVRTEHATVAYLHDVIAPTILGRDTTEREAIWQDLYRLNRKLVFFPMYLPGPVDVAIWDIVCKEAGMPLHRYLGSCKTRLQAYVSSQFMQNVEDYVDEASRYADLGLTAYKAHPGGDWRRHIEIAEGLRAAFPDWVLMMDPAGVDYSLETAVTVGRELERLNFLWLEEPFHEVHIAKYASLCKTLDIAVCTTEAVYGGPAGIAEFITAGAADIVRADVGWRWGVTGTMKSFHLAEAHGLNCELHTTMSPLDVVNIQVACSVANSQFFELYAPHEEWRFPAESKIDLGSDGFVTVGEEPGVGLKLDQEALDRGDERTTQL